jgi:alpha-L-fucosidase 2
LNNFSETYIDFGHSFDEVTDYSRSLDLSDAVARVEYSYKGVKYNRECFCSYPDRAVVIHLSASRDGALSFTLRPTVPYRQEFACNEGDGASKSGEVVARVENCKGIVELFGKLGYYDIDYLGIYSVSVDKGEVINKVSGARPKEAILDLLRK